MCYIFQKKITWAKKRSLSIASGLNICPYTIPNKISSTWLLTDTCELVSKSSTEQQVFRSSISVTFCDLGPGTTLLELCACALFNFNCQQKHNANLRQDTDMHINHHSVHISINYIYICVALIDQWCISNPIIQASPPGSLVGKDCHLWRVVPLKEGPGKARSVRNLGKGTPPPNATP